MNDEPTKQTDTETRVLRKVYAWLVAGGLTFGGVAGSGVLRPDAFTGTDAKLMRAQLEHQINVKVWDVKKHMPPQATRLRIRALEHCMENACDDYEVPTQEW